MNNAEHAAPVVDDCWNRIGMRGDRSCGELRRYGHCMHCPVYADAAGSILQRPVPAAYRRDWARHFAAAAPAVPETEETAVIFRAGIEWLALPASLAVTVAPLAQAHRIPHRGGRGLLGVVNVKGMLYPCVSLPALLGIDAAEPDAARNAPQAEDLRIHPRLLVAQLGAHAYAFPVQEVHGLHRYTAADMQAPPTTAGKTAQPWLRGALRIEVGLARDRRTDASGDDDRSAGHRDAGHRSAGRRNAGRQDDARSDAGCLHVGFLDAELLGRILAGLLK